MNKHQYWTTKCINSGGQYNDEAEYAIFNGNGERIVRDGDRELLAIICEKHNLCFIEDTAP